MRRALTLAALAGVGFVVGWAVRSVLATSAAWAEVQAELAEVRKLGGAGRNVMPGRWPDHLAAVPPERPLYGPGGPWRAER